MRIANLAQTLLIRNQTLETQARLQTVEQQIASGEVHSFQGPIYDQQGNLIVAEGEVLTDEDLLQMDYYVDGISGSMPN